MTTRHLLQLSVCFAVATCFTAIGAEEQAARKEVNVDVKQRLQDEVTKLEELEKQWQQNKDSKSELKIEPKTKEEKEAYKAKKKAAESAEKEAKARAKAAEKNAAANSDNSGARVERSGNGAYVEAGGVSSSNRSSSSSYGSHSNSSSSSNSSVGVRATVIRLE
jgi:hypothetical protein